MREIKLTQGKVAIVDNEDFDYLNQYKWFASKDVYTFYAQRNVKKGKSRTGLLMHREIVNAGVGEEVDHINKNGLDNRRGNLRLCSKSNNLMNSKVRKDNRIGCKGVSWRDDMQKWRVRLYCNKKCIELGNFILLEDAVKVYERAAKEYFGDYKPRVEV